MKTGTIISASAVDNDSRLLRLRIQSANHEPDTHVTIDTNEIAVPDNRRTLVGRRIEFSLDDNGNMTAMRAPNEAA